MSEHTANQSNRPGTPVRSFFRLPAASLEPWKPAAGPRQARRWPLAMPLLALLWAGAWLTTQQEGSQGAASSAGTVNQANVVDDIVDVIEDIIDDLSGDDEEGEGGSTSP